MSRTTSQPDARTVAAEHRLAHLIGGEMVPAASGDWLETVEPATGRFLAHLPDGDTRDVDRAVAAATQAARRWARTPAAERSRVLLRLAERVEANAEALARLESIDTGKPLTLARAVDIPRAVANLRFFATAILHTRSDAHITDEAAINYTLRQPRGVAGCISPWNLPLYLFTWKIAPALATGNTVVGKPSEVTPMTAHRLGELAIEAELPPGVLNIVHGLGPKVGAALVEHPAVPAISFTGGTATGAAIAAAAGPMFKKLSLELGGKNPTIVFADADLDHAVPTAVRAAFANQGQICLCGSRVFVERPIFDSFVAAFVRRTEALRSGDPLEPETEQGALVSKSHLEKVQSYLRLAEAEGGRIVTGGDRPAGLPVRCGDGYFLRPAVITGLDAACRTNREEIFGPVVSIIPFDDEAEVVAAANATEYGLAASVWTGSIDRGHRVAAELQAGTVWVNCWLLRDLRVPFGGMKSSGVGREGGDEAMHFFTEPKNVCIKRNERPGDAE
ncbi:MAG: aldehyde dehydrogenase [Phycisphaerae bacterium]|nr:aldehyde dehydrogenase [Phycisphaerae bacterium]